MSVVAYVADDLFTFRITKYLSTNPDNKWVNSYEFKATEAGTEGELLTLGGILVDFEAALHRNAVVFDRILISTWSPDSVPYDPETFISSSLTAVGGRGTDADLVPLSTCLSVTRQASSGRFGHIYYRGALDEEDVSSPAGKSILTNRAEWQTLIDGAILSSGLEDYIGLGTGGGFELSMVNADGTQVRKVNALFAQGVAQVKPDHKWFNRTTAP